MVDVVWLPRDAQRTVPWRNGLGSTREVAIEPVSGSVERGFDWRISRAGVANDGPFSSFPGIDRSLWLVRGAGLELRIDECSERLERPWQRVDFAGEAEVSARLLGGPIEDLNVMVRRGAVRAAAKIHELCDGAELPILWEAGSQVVLCLQGAVALLGGVLGAGDAVRCDGAGSCTLLALDGRPVVLVASFGAA
jgi:environmental stress-induced protein Ves